MNSAVGNESNEWRAFSVIAPIDTGINVYHDHFRTNETYPLWLLDDLGVNKVCDLTFNGAGKRGMTQTEQIAGTT